MLGTAPAGRLAEIVEHLIARDAASALSDVESAVGEGIDVGQFAEQLLGYFRDMIECIRIDPDNVLLRRFVVFMCFLSI